MDWVSFLWIIFTLLNLTLLGLNFYEFLGFSDLEADYLNPYELSSLINYVIVPEYLLHGALCILFLMTGHWIMFLLSLPTAYYNLKQYLSNKHLVDVTEVFKVVNTGKKAHLIKLAFYVIFFGLVITRTIAMGALFSVLSVLCSNDKEVDFRFQVLEC
ncbi:protein cornichon homolog 1-like isoform X1 [Salvia splendens]|uniref:protein cornichon homolog 1-like isoform X1 n=1 Tax=Salvia splendens TaxID=180675 RepID=UPI001C25BFAD|nr:protein cornichon homolog 1-like isoform X1 [Salvia splendens]